MHEHSPAKMEVSFYGNEENQATMTTVKQLKQKMTLDFANSSSTKKEKAGAAGLLASPDLNMLKLASPELERMIIQQNGTLHFFNCKFKSCPVVKQSLTSWRWHYRLIFDLECCREKIILECLYFVIQVW